MDKQSATFIDSQYLTRNPLADLHALRRKYRAAVKAKLRAALLAAKLSATCAPARNFRACIFPACWAGYTRVWPRDCC